MQGIACLKQELRHWPSLVKFSHTIFALPFALGMLVYVNSLKAVSFGQIFFIVLALVSARTAAMTFNRLVDRHIDKLNPRTLNRELVSGKVSLLGANLLLVFSSAVFLGSAALLGTHCLVLAPFVLAVLFAYSLTKRFTSSSHLVLGLSLALAPGGVWYATMGTVELRPVILMFGVLLWVAGFDIIYSTQDVEFDRKVGLFSLPSKLGVKRSLRLSTIVHISAIAAFLAFGAYGDLGVGYYWSLLVFSIVLLSQHLIVSADDLSRVNQAFFVRNGIASTLFFVAVCLGT